jgi:CRISPR/Cas system CMR-associated protein Cmr5 small subunit
MHQCGLAQAVAFAQAKGDHQVDYANDLASVLKAVGHDNITSADVLATQTRSLPMNGYVRLSRDALDAAVWLKRYVEALFADVAQPAGAKS